MRIQINVMEKKHYSVQNRSQNIFSCAYATMKPKVTLTLFFYAFRERPLIYCLKPILEVRMQTVFQIHLLSFFDVMYYKVHRNGLT